MRNTFDQTPAIQDPGSNRRGDILQKGALILLGLVYTHEVLSHGVTKLAMY